MLMLKRYLIKWISQNVQPDRITWRSDFSTGEEVSSQGKLVGGQLYSRVKMVNCDVITFIDNEHYFVEYWYGCTSIERMYVQIE